MTDQGFKEKSVCGLHQEEKLIMLMLDMAKVGGDATLPKIS